MTVSFKRQNLEAMENLNLVQIGNLSIISPNVSYLSGDEASKQCAIRGILNLGHFSSFS